MPARTMRRLLVLLLALAFGPAARAGGPQMLVGAAEDNVLQPTLTQAKAQMDLAKLAGLDAIRFTATWSRGVSAPQADRITIVQNAAAAASLDGVETFLSVYPFGSSQTPLSDKDQSDFAAWTAALARAAPSVHNFIVGNEPNLNRFWLPQFGPSGENVAAPAYESLLARTYDALKAVSPRIMVFGGAVSPHGVDKPNTGRDTHSPTIFIPDMGAAYRASGRTSPIMDGFAFHPYEDNSSVPPTETHPAPLTEVAIADYDKLVSLLGEAFDGSAQQGSTLPILYDEFGVETQIPGDKVSLYTGNEPATIHPVDEQTQGEYYRQAFQLAFCQPNVVGIFLFHVVDESSRPSWQSGVFYTDGRPKASLPVVSAAARQIYRGVITRCPGLALTPQPTLVFALPSELRRPQIPVHLTCDIDCLYYVRLERLPRHSVVVATRGRARGRFGTKILLPQVRLARGTYRVTIRLWAPVNVGPAVDRASAPFTISG